MAIAIGILVLVVITLLFHFMSPWWFTPIASNWSSIDLTVDITFWITGFVFVVVNLFLVWVVIKYRHKEGRKAHYEPESKKLETWLSVITTVGVVAMLAPGLWVYGKVTQVPEDAEVVEVIGQQWHWSFRFPGADGVLGQTSVAVMSVDNPFGMRADDPAGQDDILIADAELHLPIDQPYKFVLRSKDVLHNFTVPQFRVKMDLVPGMSPYAWLTPTRKGRFDIMCEELCGIAHHTMRGVLVVEDEGDFQTWLQGYPTYAETAARPAGNPEVGQATYGLCGTCHGAQAEGIQQLNAPKLAGLDSWYMSRQLRNYKAGVRGAHEADSYGAQMAPMAATLVDDLAIDNVLAYIGTLPDESAPATIAGDAEHGKDLFITCESCHGKQGQGIWALNAPRLSGMNDWYIIRQLDNYRQGIRGAHPQDLYGKQMGFMARVVRDEQDINDLVAYINSL